jgi:nitrate/nitrite-specific signal transduction histidine kinase
MIGVAAMRESWRDVFFPVTSTAPRRARGWAQRVLQVDDHSRNVVLLLLSELVTNSVRHSGASSREQIHVAVRERGHVVHVEVRDPGPGLGIALGEVPAHSGLQIVDALSARWGVRHDPTTVWFDVTA